ncbi:hypothetical protein JOB18_017398 [Solea senegalensis]|uniref:Uncharacterized protein n=1 Tax=Solea senegalensis TaxID=28829 RepID=A0AAV6SYK6_SOLSE|nr:hypothetical protein JOB18_017398 [Solea senegalensis]
MCYITNERSNNKVHHRLSEQAVNHTEYNVLQLRDHPENTPVKLCFTLYYFSPFNVSGMAYTATVELDETYGERGKGRRRVRKEEEEEEEEEESAGDWTQSLHTQLKESSAQRHSLATCVLTFVFLSVVIYGTMELKAKLAAAQHQRLHSNVGTGEDCQIGSGIVPLSRFHRLTLQRRASERGSPLTAESK